MKSKEKAFSGALAQACNTIKTLMAAGAQHEAINKYKIGAKVVDLQREVGKYGKNSVGKVAKAVGCTRALLYSYATVAETWTEDRFKTALAKKNEHGVALTFSHFVELARKESKTGKRLDESKRRELHDKALKDNLSVRALGELVRRALQPFDIDSRISSPLQDLSRLWHQFSGRTAAFADLVNELEQEGPAAGDAAQLKLAIENAQAIHLAYGGLLDRLRALRVEAHAEAAE